MLGIEGTPSDLCKRFFSSMSDFEFLCSYFNGIGRLRRPNLLPTQNSCELPKAVRIQEKRRLEELPLSPYAKMNVTKNLYPERKK
jgi:hypothetical protein